MQRRYLSAEHLDTEHVQCLPPHVLSSHVNDAFESKFGAHGRRGDAVLTSTGFRNNTGFPESLC